MAHEWRNDGENDTSPRTAYCYSALLDITNVNFSDCFVLTRFKSYCVALHPVRYSRVVAIMLLDQDPASVRNITHHLEPI